jgi:SHS family lactate transporter-like MFS transporter
VRGFLPGFAYQCGVLIASSIVYLQALLAAHTTYATAMALGAVIVCVGGVLATAAGRERRGVTFGGDGERSE